ncbi:MAG: FAD-dependent oxidoreductase [Cyanobacteria bacterium P01_G01_bin.4]
MVYDLLVIGAGSGGLSVAKTASKYGAKVAIAEASSVGGTCVNRGCIPKKLAFYAASFLEQQQIASRYGWTSDDSSFDWNSLAISIAQNLDGLRQTQQETLQEDNIELIRGTARFVDEHTVAIKDRHVKAHNIAISVGSKPIMPGIPGSEFALDSSDMFQLEELPKRLAVVGGGYIGVEFSSILSRLGAEITLIDTDPHLLGGFDRHLQDFVKQRLQNSGVAVILQSQCKAIEKDSETLNLQISNRESVLTGFDAVLMAVGREPNLQSLQIQKAGIELNDSKYIAVDNCYRTIQPHIYAIGDCVGRMPLTPVAIAEGEVVATTLFSEDSDAVDYRWIPSAVFNHPPIATVGWSEDDARKKSNAEVGTKCQWFTPLRESLLADILHLIQEVVERRGQKGRDYLGAPAIAVCVGNANRASSE